MNRKPTDGDRKVDPAPGKPEAPDSDKYELTLNQKVHTRTSATITGQQLLDLARLPDPSKYSVWRKVPGAAEQQIGMDTSVELTHNASDSEFFTIDDQITEGLGQC